jgi:hypothetical protein
LLDDQIGILIADAVHHLAIMRELHARLAVGMAHMNMRDRCARLGRFQGRGGDLFGRAGQAGMLLHGGEIAGHRDREDRLLSFVGHFRFTPSARR